MQQRTCTVSECDKPLRSSGAEWCAMHYHRWYRHGDVNLTANRSGITVSHGRRYRSAHRPDHPLATPSGRVYVHQIVLYAAIGPGTHACHWCSSSVRWDAAKDAHDRLNVDHLNGVGDDNRAENLVPSCRGCNTARALQARSEVLRKKGWWSNHDTLGILGTRLPTVTAHAG